MRYANLFRLISLCILVVFLPDYGRGEDAHNTSEGNELYQSSVLSVQNDCFRSAPFVSVKCDKNGVEGNVRYVDSDFPGTGGVTSIRGERYTKISCRDLNRFLEFEPKKIFYGGVMINTGDTLYGPVVVIAGPLDIQHRGVLKGDAWVVNGKVVLTGAGRINGGVKLINSGIFSSSRAEVTGPVERYSCECELRDRVYEEEDKVVFRERLDPRAVRIQPSVKPGLPNRTDYQLLRIGLKRENPLHRDPYVWAEALLHVPLWKESGGHLGFNMDISIPLGSENNRLIVRGFKETFTNDAWQLSRCENSLAVIYTGDDFADYYERRGVSAGVRSRSWDHLILESRLSFQEDVSLSARSLPSLFSSRQKFRANPPIREGKRFFLTVSLELDTRRVRYSPTQGWRLDMTAEKGFADGPGDFSYLTLDVEATRYNRLPLGLGLDIRTKLFSAFGEIPEQNTMSLNGYGGIRGVSDDPFPVHRGDRLALLSVELSREMPRIPVMKSLFTGWSLVGFWDQGLLKMADNNEAALAFLDTPSDNWKRSVGFGIAGESVLPMVAIYLAQDIDKDSFDPRVILRARLSF